LIRSWRRDLTLTAEFVVGQQVWVASRQDIGQSVPGLSKQRADALAGFYCLLPGAEDAWGLEHLWVDPPYIGEGLGGSLFSHAISCARGAGGRSLRIVSDPNAVGFYEHMGARKVAEEVGDPLDGKARVLPVYCLDL
jgi:GNAT superfamily N-acetyltransferase